MSQTRFAFFKGRIVPIEEANLNVRTHALHYGTGVFEGIRAYWNDEQSQLYAFRLREHVERFVRNARLLMIELPHDVDRLCGIILELLRKEGFREDAYIRPLAYKSQELIGAIRLHEVAGDLAIVCLTLNKVIDRPQGCHAGVSSWRRVEDVAIPPRGKITGSYANSALIKTEAVLNGYDEAIVLNADGHASEGSASNLMLLRDGALLTPPVTDNILEGITRATVLQFARERLGLTVHERQIDRTELYCAEEMFFCGTGVEIVPITRVDHRPVGDGHVGPICTQVREGYQRLVRGRDAEHGAWCTPVYDGPVYDRPADA